MENKFMKIALEEAEKAIKEGEMPVGAVVVKDGEVIAKGHNVRNVEHDPTLHAEIVAIRKACELISDWRLSDCDLYVTLEPCVMCSGAIINSRMKSVYFGAYDTKSGCCGSALNLFDKNLCNYSLDATGGILQDECADLMRTFFKELRKR